MKDKLQRHISIKQKSTAGFQEKYMYFQALLADNEEAHKAMSELTEAVASGKPFSQGYAKQKLDFLLIILNSMVRRLIAMSGSKYACLLDRIRELGNICNAAFLPGIICPEGLSCPDTDCENCNKAERLFLDTPYFIDLNNIDDRNILQVGNKMARLGELKNILGIPVPDGFCLSVRLFEELISTDNIKSKKDKLFYNLDFQDVARVQYVSRQIQALLVSAQLPEEIENMILEGYESKFGNRKVILAVRSSAFGEDSEARSFAGLHRTILNVSREYLIDAVIDVLISVYSPQSVIYRYLSGIRDEDMPMSVGCIEMVDAKSGGVLYTEDPNGLKEGMILQSVWGLGAQVVDGSVKPQEFIIKDIDGNPDIMFNPGIQDGEEIQEINNESEINSIELNTHTEPSISNNEILELYEYAKKIEKHYKIPQDIEWAVSKDGKVFILQARPLKTRNISKGETKKSINTEELNNKYKVVIKSGECAGAGIGIGKVFVVRSTRDIARIPDGAVVVARKTMIELTSVIQKISALITDIGSTTGHLAIITREFRVPHLTNTLNASEILSDGMEVTVIADAALVYEGILSELSDYSNISNLENSYLKSPHHQVWSKLTKYLFQLNLYDTRSDEFTADNCRTMHDIIRYVHEISMRTMFSIYDDTSDENASAYKLLFDVPLDLYIIDLGGGLKKNEGKYVTPEDILSIQMQHLISGMTAPGISWSGHLSLDTKGFAEMVMGNISGSSLPAAEPKSYALISDTYMNFFSQLGYHFSRLDSFASDDTHKNYINFSFRGGASNIIRKSRRAEAISRILEALNFTTQRCDDEITAKIIHVQKDTIYYLIFEIGKLMGAVRNTDVMMLSDYHIDIFVEEFLKGSASPADKLK
ncbi:MAG: pyruvate, water dikinase [Bacteroidota bacterium]|nr:pyruvate, water dikinase [Bacteroidota bacterium]